MFEFQSTAGEMITKSRRDFDVFRQSDDANKRLPKSLFAIESADDRSVIVERLGQDVSGIQESQ